MQGVSLDSIIAAVYSWAAGAGHLVWTDWPPNQYWALKPVNHSGTLRGWPLTSRELLSLKVHCASVEAARCTSVIMYYGVAKWQEVLLASTVSKVKVLIALSAKLMLLGSWTDMKLPKQAKTSNWVKGCFDKKSNIQPCSNHKFNFQGVLW